MPRKKPRNEKTCAHRTGANSVILAPVVSPVAAPKSNLRPPWKKGQSGNPAGYPKKYAEIVKLARMHTEAAIQRLAETLDSPDERAAVLAAQILLERGWGKAREHPDESEHLRDGGGEPDFSFLTIQERGQFSNLLEKMLRKDPADRERSRNSRLELLGIARPSR